MSLSDPRPVLVIGGGIGGLAAALALASIGVRVTLLEQAPTLGELGAGIQLGPNAFNALDYLGVGANARARAVYIDRLVMMDAIDGREIAGVPVTEDFRVRYGNPYAVIHRADIHKAIQEGVEARPEVTVRTGTRIERFAQDEHGVVAFDADGGEHRGVALLGADGTKSAIRAQIVGDDRRISGHVVYRAVVPYDDMPDDLRWNAACLWAGPNNHVVHYPLQGWRSFNLVVTFHSRDTETGDVSEGSRDEVMSYFTDICDRPRALLDKPTQWKRWSTADRDPVDNWTQGRATLLGDAAHPMLQYLAQGAAMAIEDAVCLREAVRMADFDFPRAFALYQAARITRTARVQLMAREMGRIYHAAGVARLVRNSLWEGRTPEKFYDSLDWLYGWTAQQGLAAALAAAAVPAGGSR
jgi:salicylate hydroxylase